MSFGSFLGALGHVFAAIPGHFRSFDSAIELVGPALLAAAGVPAALIPTVLSLVRKVESIGGEGSTKKSNVMTGIESVVSIANAVRPGTFDSPAVTDAVNRGIDDVIAAVKAVHAQTRTTPPTAPAPTAPPQ